MVSHERRLLFVHVQKTGGSTVDRVLEQVLPDATYLKGLNGGRHARLRAALARHPELSGYWIFGFVRNPWARMLSWYAMVERITAAAAGGDADAQARLAKQRWWREVSERYPDFRSFVMDGTEREERLSWPQVSYLRTSERTADFIGRQESFDADFGSVLDRLGVEAPAEMPRYNAGEERDYRASYDDAMRDRVAEVFARDLARFGYEF